MKLVAAFVIALAPGVVSGQQPPSFMGRAVSITEPELDADGFPSGKPASVCVEGPPQRQCYTLPKPFGGNPRVTVVDIRKDVPALLFSAASPGVSGFVVHFALLRPGDGKQLDDLFMSGTEISNQSRHAFWTDPSVSDAKIFVTADYVWGRDESHYSEHRYILSAYVLHRSLDLEMDGYYLEDRYMTVRSYDLEAKADVLESEREEILARLRRVKAATERH